MNYFRRLFGTALMGALLVGATACDDDDDGPTGPDPLQRVSNVQVTQDAGAAVITWSAVTGAESYTVQRSDENAAYAEIASGITALTHTDASVTAGVDYEYRVIAVRGSERSAPSDEVAFSIGLAARTLSGTISGTHNLSADTVYTLSGLVQVEEGATLNIEAGTTILGDTDITPTLLFVARGGRIVANGTADAPIVFTSERPAGSRAAGDWGGVMINGRSLCNLGSDPCISEGVAQPYGGNVLDDDSGVLRYVRIEFAGYEVSFGNELNGLTLNGVGSGTEIDHIQVNVGLDDGIELFGGTVNISHALITNASDDSFDYCCGWQGRGQFWIAQQDPNDADTGFEVDSNEADNDATPRVNPTLYNVTLIGKGSTGTAGESTRGVHYRRGAAGTLANFVVLGFEVGLDIDNTATYEQCAAGEFVLTSAIFAGNAELYDADADAESGCVALPAWANIEVDPAGDVLVDPFDRASPDFRPVAGGAALTTPAATPPDDGFFDTSATYLGAVAPTGTPWYQGWTTTATN